MLASKLDGEVDLYREKKRLRYVWKKYCTLLCRAPQCQYLLVKQVTAVLHPRSYAARKNVTTVLFPSNPALYLTHYFPSYKNPAGQFLLDGLQGPVSYRVALLCTLLFWQ